MKEMGRRRHGEGKGKGKGKAQSSSDESMLAEARKLKQQAERRSEGPERAALLERCAPLFQNALHSSLPPRDREEALFDLGEVFLLWSSAVKKGSHLGTCSALRGNIKKFQAIQMQLEASICAASLCRQSLEAFQSISSMEGSELKQESNVNSGNALCDLAELVCEIPTDKDGGTSLAADLYAQADNRYSEALASDPDDIELLTNLGDCCVKRAELAFASEKHDQTTIDEVWTSARKFYERAFSAYANACSRADVRFGDDLAGLLLNWGAGWISLAERTPDTVEAVEAFNYAEEKIRNAANFSLADINVCIALGELFSLQAERISQFPHQEPQEVLNLLERAMNEGYGAALRIDSTNFDAIIGLGEVHFTSAKHCLCSGDNERAKEYSLKSLQWYMKAVNLLEEDVVGKCGLSFEEQCDLLYNMGCAAEICGQEDSSSRAFKHLVQIDGITPSDLAEDPDLEGLRQKDWFISLIHQKS